jgi:hypothetical protein
MIDHFLKELMNTIIQNTLKAGYKMCTKQNDRLTTAQTENITNLTASSVPQPLYEIWQL